MAYIVSHHLSCLLFLCAFRQPTTDTEPDFHDFRFRDANGKKEINIEKEKNRKKWTLLKKKNTNQKIRFTRIKKNINERKGGRQVSLHTRLILPLSRITRGPDDFLLYLLMLLISSHFLFRFLILVTLVESVVLYKVFCCKLIFLKMLQILTSIIFMSNMW